MKVVAARTVWLAIVLVALLAPGRVAADSPRSAAPPARTGAPAVRDHESAAPAPAVPVPPVPAPAAPPVLFEPGTDLPEVPPAPEGACIGGDCLDAPVQRGVALPLPRSAARAAYGASVFGAVAAGLLLGGAVAIAVADHPDSERVTRGLWLGTMLLSPPIVGLSAHLARRNRGVEGIKSARRLGWVAYSSAVTGGVLGWVGAFRDEITPPWLTVSGGVFATLCMLPLALDALVSARHARVTPPRARLVPSFSGLGVRF